MKKILIVVDAQHDFVDGSLANPEAQKVIADLANYLRFAAPGQFQKIYLTLDTHQDNYLDTPEGKKLPIEHCIKRTPGWCVMEDLVKAIRKNYIFSSNSPSAIYVEKPTFGYVDWDKTFSYYYDEDVDEIVLVGFCTDICVLSNALILKAMYPDVKIKVLSRFCAGLTPEKHAAALEVMKSCQIDVVEDNE